MHFCVWNQVSMTEGYMDVRVHHRTDAEKKTVAQRENGLLPHLTIFYKLFPNFLRRTKIIMIQCVQQMICPSISLRDPDVERFWRPGDTRDVLVHVGEGTGGADVKVKVLEEMKNVIYFAFLASVC